MTRNLLIFMDLRRERGNLRNVVELKLVGIWTPHLPTQLAIPNHHGELCA